MFSHIESCGYKIYGNKRIKEVFLSEDSYSYNCEKASLAMQDENDIFNVLIYLYGLINSKFSIYPEYKIWVGMENGPSLEPNAIVYDKKRKICISENFIFPNIDGLVSDQIKEVRKAYNNLLTIINDCGLSDILSTKLMIDYSDRSDRKPELNKEYDEIELPYKYFSKKWVCLRLTLDINKLNEVYSGFFRLCGNNELVRDHELNSICPLYVYE